MKWRIAAAGGLALLAIALAAAWYLRSAAFQARVGGFVAEQIRGQLGLTPRFQAFHFTWRPLGFELDGLVLQGRERGAQPPLAAMPRVVVRLDPHALRHGRVVLERVDVTAPVIHLYPLADGGLNLPQSNASASGRAMPPLLFQFQVQRLVATGGGLWLRDRWIPIAFNLAGLRFELRARGADYDGDAIFSGDPGALGRWRPGTVRAQAQFLLGANRLQLVQLTANSAAGTAILQGDVPDFAHPAFRGSWQSAGELPTVAQELGYAGLAAGHIAAQGEAAWNIDGAHLAGTFQFAGARLQPPAPPLATWSGVGRFQAGPAGISWDAVRLHGLASEVELSGGWKGDAWQAQASVHGLELAALQPLLRYERLDPRLLAGLATLAARLDGTVEVAARGTAAPSARMQLALISDPAPAGHLATNGDTTLQIENGTVNVNRLELAFADSRLSASGQPASNLHAHLETGDLRQLSPLLAPWLPTLAATFPGIAAPGWDHVGGAGQLDADLHGMAGGGAAVQVQAALQHLQWGALHADTLSTGLDIAPSAWRVTRLELRRGAESLSLQGRIAAVAYRPAPDSPLQLHLDAQHLAIADWRDLAGMAAPVTGWLNLTADLGGTLAGPSGAGRFTSAQLAWGAQPLGAVSGSFNADRGHITIADLAVALGPSHLNGSLRLELAAHHYAVTIQSADADLSELKLLQSSRVRVSGPARVELTGEGDWRAPQAVLTVSAPRTTAAWGGSAGIAGSGSEALGDLEMLLRLSQGVLTFQLGDLLPSGGFTAQGSLATAAPHQLNAALQLSGYDFDAWLRRFTTLPITAHSLATGTVRVVGPLDDSKRLQATADFDAVALTLAGRRFRNQGPVRLEANPAGVGVAAAHFVAPQCDFTLSGRLLAGLPPSLDLTLAGNADLGVLSVFDPDLHAAGRLDVATTLTGPLDHPQLGGTLALRDGSLAEAGFPVALDQVAGRVRLNGNRAQIENLTARAGGGTLSFGGFATRSGDNFLVDVSATGRDTRVRYLGIAATGNLDLRLVVQPSGGLIAGDLTLNRISLGDEFDLAAFIANSRVTAPPTPSDSLLGRVRLDVRLATGPQVQLNSAGAQLSLQADLRLRGTLAEPSLIGRASASAGSVFFAGYRYRVDKGDVEFSNPFRIEPLLDLELSTSIPPYDVTLNVTGPADKLNITYRSDPPLSSADIVNLLATGTPTQATGTLSQQAAGTFAGQSEQLLGRALQNAVSGRLQQLFGITQVEVSPNSVINGAASNGSSVVIQQQVSRNLKLTYTENLSSSAQDIVQVEWTLTRTLGITLSRDQFGLYGLEFVVQKRVH